ncbi:sterol desaturase family protein [Roseovarius sp. MS2]|uniref:sterol desaturase family protein n=1 Tax=Roseovarius sp. MS2 TaxID=3390728 RepID=UPI003F5CBB28
MSDMLLNAEAAIRLTIFLGILIGMMLWELSAPRRRQEIPRVLRWTNNLGLVVLDTVILRLTFLCLLSVWRCSGLKKAGPLQQYRRTRLGGDPRLGAGARPGDLPAACAVSRSAGAVAAAPDASRRPRIRRHHRLRFHPVEIVMSMGIKLAVVAALGPPAVAVLIFEVLLNGTALFNSRQYRPAAPGGSLVRLIVVTPDMHRVHHSTDPRETNSNYGFNLPWWDRLLGTYVAQPAKGHHGMEIGIGAVPNAARSVARSDAGAARFAARPRAMPWTPGSQRRSQRNETPDPAK